MQCNILFRGKRVTLRQMSKYKSSTTPVSYYAFNGLQYRCNPETNTFEEIEKMTIYNT